MDLENNLICFSPSTMEQLGLRGIPALQLSAQTMKEKENRSLKELLILNFNDEMGCQVQYNLILI